MKHIFLRVGVSAALFFLCLGGGAKAWGHDTDASGRSIPVAKQDGLLEQGFRFLFIPSDILNGILNREGEFYAKGRVPKGEYARHGYYRYYPRWYDTFQYYHD